MHQCYAKKILTHTLKITTVSNALQKLRLTTMLDFSILAYVTTAGEHTTVPVNLTITRNTNAFRTT